MYSFITYVPGIVSHLNLCVPLLNTHARSLFCFIFMGCETHGSSAVALQSLESCCQRCTAEFAQHIYTCGTPGSVYDKTENAAAVGQEANCCSYQGLHARWKSDKFS